MRQTTLAALALAGLLLPLAPARAASTAPTDAAPAAATARDDEAPAHAELPPGTRNGVLRNLQVPPPGSPADVALWRRANDNDLNLMAARGEATRLQAAAATSGYARRLDEAVAGGLLSAARAAALKAKLEEEWTEVIGIATARWRIDPTRVCRYPFLAYDNLMEMADGPTKGPRLAEARGRLLDCTTHAEAILGQLSRANASLRKALADVDRAAGPAATVAAAGPAEESR